MVECKLPVGGVSRSDDIGLVVEVPAFYSDIFKRDPHKNYRFFLIHRGSIPSFAIYYLNGDALTLEHSNKEYVFVKLEGNRVLAKQNMTSSKASYFLYVMEV